MLLGEEPERGPGADKSDYTGWAGSLSVVVVVGSVFLLGHSRRYDHTQVLWIISQSRSYQTQMQEAEVLSTHRCTYVVKSLAQGEQSCKKKV